MKKISFILLGLLATAGSFAQRTCGQMEHLDHQLAQDPSVAARMQEVEEHTENFVRNNPNGTRLVVTIPVVVHVVYNTAAQNVSDAQINSQMTVLNADFRKLNADASLIPAAFSSVAADCEVQFCLAQRTPTGAATTGIERRSTTVTGFSTNDAMKKYSTGGLDAWDATKYLNLWVCNMTGGILGYAQFPGGAAATDGVVILYSAFGTTGTAAAPFNKGRTATHEVGHWLNLRHIWGDATCGSDLVGDTPTHNTSNYGCPTYPHLSTCTGTPTEMTMNYMDYTDDACMYMFSAGQKTRMQALFATGGARVSLTTSDGCTPPTTSSCPTPTGVAVASITNTGATVSWAAAAGATSYQILVGANTYTSTTTSYTLSGLTACTGYSVSVKAVCSTTSTSAASTSVSFTTTGCTTVACPTSATDTYESNNTASTAKTIAKNTDIAAKIGTSTDVDWFTFTTTSTDPKVKITLTGLPADYDVKLYKSNGTTQLGVSQNSGTTSETILYNTATTGATYRVKVYGYSSAFSGTACYTLRAATGATNFVRLGDEPESDDFKPMMTDMTVYPNPTDGIANLTFNVVEEDMNVNLSVIDQTGRIIRTSSHSVTKSVNQVELDFSELANGVYFLQIQNGDAVSIQKVVIAK